MAPVAMEDTGAETFKDRLPKAFVSANQYPEKEDWELAGGREGAGEKVTKTTAPIYYPLATAENQRFRVSFAKPLKLSLERDPHMYIFFHEGSCVMGTGPTIPDALADFQDAFIRIYLSYYETVEKELSNSAIQFAHYLKSLVKKDEPIQNPGV